MPMEMNQVPDGVEEKILALFNETLESQTGNIHYRCGPNRAKYLHRWARFLRDSSAVSSIHTFPPDHPLYGVGVYWNLETIPTKFGLLFRIIEEPTLSPSQLILRTAIHKKNFDIEFDSPESARRLLANLIACKKTLERKGVDRKVISSVSVYIDGKSVHIHYAPNVKTGTQELTEDEVEALLNVPRRKKSKDYIRRLEEEEDDDLL